MLKTSLLRLSESSAAKKIITRAPLSRSFAQRFVAGDTLDEALQAARVLNDAGLTVSLDFLGESVQSREEAEAAAQMAVRVLEAIVREGLRANLSIKPTQLGLDIDEAFCRANVETVLRRARELGDGEGEIFVRLDMESSAYTERTVALVESLWADGFHNVGTVLQSMLRRTPDDLERLIALGSRVRLVKGAYQEPESGGLSRQGRRGPDVRGGDEAAAGSRPLSRHRHARRGHHRRRPPLRLGAGDRQGVVRVPDAVRRAPRPADAAARGGLQRARVRALRRLVVSRTSCAAWRSARPTCSSWPAASSRRRAATRGCASRRWRVGAGFVAGIAAALFFRRRR